MNRRRRSLSTWRGKFNATTGKVTLDQAAKSGSIDITIDVASVDFGNDKLNEHSLKEPKMFDVAKNRGRGIPRLKLRRQPEGGTLR